ncbi:ATP-dependent DNA helicase Rep [Usitatibacter rugosus]|uniref:DNA 3'-5' helicase n=1 Tax=Usitatibacter rugosus TaxID=2732067 RepID=A0A6M4GPW5_9PROT|nr:UvrD-helicase domain-containing protein [Usitatibacter rugosus]QJR09115.1 ATP-dependent DNA helicase Rep [Usitatibacter rugosus]
MHALVSGLNPEQHQAVTLPRESALILAGAGSGKTRVLTTRIAYLVQTGQVSPAGILAVTFTNKAAREMLTRLSAMLPINTRGMWIGTFHGLCNRMLRAHFRDASLPQLFQILDSADQQALIKRLAKAQGVDEEKFPPRQLQNFINNCKEMGLRANAVEAGDDFTRRMVAFYADYDAQCNREGVVDFAELLLRTYELLTKHLNLLHHYQERFKYILVDEFQDTNKLQYKWIKLLAGTNGCVFAVGDDDQCLVEGTAVTMAGGEYKAIEDVRPGDRVMTCLAEGVMGVAKVVGVHASRARKDLVRITLRDGRTLTSTPEHAHFAGFVAVEETHDGFTVTRTARVRPGGPEMIIEQSIVPGLEEDEVELPFGQLLATQVVPGMSMLDEHGDFTVVQSVDRIAGRGRLVHDLDVEPTHNFVANGIVTHNSIYRFRGADVGNMNELVKDFGISSVVKLEQNYRSQGHILDAANAVIAQNKARLGKNLWTAEGKGEQLRVFAASNDLEEAQFVVDEVKQLHREGTNLSDMALLYRSNAQSRTLEHALFRAGISYKVYGGLRFFERQEVKHALAYLRLAGNGDDDTAFTRVVNFPTRGIGSRSIEQLQEMVERGVAPNLLKAARTGAIGGRSGSALGQFVAMIDGLTVASETLTLPELVEEILERSNLKNHYAAERDGQDRLENLTELGNAAALFAEEFEHGDTPAGEAAADVPPTGTHQQQVLAAFLSHASLEAGDHEATAGQDALQLMTVHSAKGLEFSAVFVSGLEEGLFPHDNSMNEDGGIEEERRLMYVAITRARKRLYITYAGSRMLHGQPRYGIVSRFIDEIPHELCKWIVLPEKKQFFTPQSSKWSGGYGGGHGSGERWSSGGGRAPQADPDRYATAPRAAFETKRPDAHPFAIGQNVSHAKFGEGVVLNFEGQGLDARVQVRFRNEGTKWLALQYAKLTPA